MEQFSVLFFSLDFTYLACVEYINQLRPSAISKELELYVLRTSFSLSPLIALSLSESKVVIQRKHF